MLELKDITTDEIRDWMLADTEEGNGLHEAFVCSASEGVVRRVAELSDGRIVRWVEKNRTKDNPGPAA